MAVYSVGSINMDLVAFAGRMPMPGETVLGFGLEQHPGGKGANQAVAAARAGARSVMVGALGRDVFGESLRGTLAGFGVEVGQVETVDAPTGVALITVAAGDNRIVVGPGANHFIDAERVGALDIGAGDVCLAQLETRMDVVRAAFERARSRRALALFNPAPALSEARPLFPLADVIVANETECALFAGEPFDAALPEPSIRAAAQAMGLSGEQVLIVTLGALGAVALASGRVLAVPGHRVNVVDTTGAGDCFCGYLSAALSCKETVETALREANAAAALAVQGKGAASSIPARDEVRRFLDRQRSVGDPG
jgi:ribokinase